MAPGSGDVESKLHNHSLENAQPEMA